MNESGMEDLERRLFENQALTYKDMVVRLQVSKRSIERLVSDGEIPHRKIGRQVRFYWPAIAAWLAKDKGARKR